MKRKIALVLAAVMTTAMLPMNAMAGSSNSISKVVTVRADEELLSNGSPIQLVVQPRDEVTSNDSIILTVENGKFDADLAQVDPYVFKTERTGTDYKTIAGRLNSGVQVFDVLKAFIGDENSRKLPYDLNVISENEMEVKLFPIPDNYVNRNNSDVTQGTPQYAIALPIITEDSSEGDITITVDDNGSSITAGGPYVVGKVIDNDGSTTASVVQSEIPVTSADTITLPTITIKEDVAGTFKGNGIVKLKVGGNYSFDTTAPVTVETGTNAAAASIAATVEDDEITFAISTGADTYNGRNALSEELFLGANASKLSSILIKGVTVIAEEDDVYGDVNITISGDSATNVSRQTLKVAERQDYGFALEVLEEVPVMYAGRTFINESDYSQDDFTSAEFRFSETTPDTWLTSRKLEFQVPEGVKIVGAEVTKTKYVSGGVSAIQSKLSVADDGQTLRVSALGNGVLDTSEASEVEFELYLVAEPTFNGDVTVTASGAGLAADTLAPITVAQFVSPITIESEITKANMGYQAMDTANIVITENAIGALSDDKDVTVKIDSLYGTQELGFADDDTQVEVSGEVEVKNFKVSNGEITFKIDSESYTAPATITISNVKVGTTRSIPYGSYDLIVCGDAVVNNYEDTLVDSYPTVVDTPEAMKLANDAIDMFDTNEGFEFDGYLTIVTETDTLDKVVEVTIGASTIKVDGEDVAMDAAAYIQTASNSTMVPLRFVSVALGVDSDNVASADESSKVMWDATTKSATILYSAGSAQKIVQFTAGSPVMTIDGTAITMENGVVAEIVDGRMYVPFRALGQALGVPVSWDADTKTAIYNQR